MDKQLLKAYIRTIVEEEVKRVLPQLLDEAVGQIKQINESNSNSSNNTSKQPAPTLDRATLAQMMGLTYDGETLTAGLSHHHGIPENQVNYSEVSGVHGTLQPADHNRANPETMKHINRDYSEVMKRLNLS